MGVLREDDRNRREAGLYVRRYEPSTFRDGLVQTRSLIIRLGTRSIRDSRTWERGCNRPVGQLGPQLGTICQAIFIQLCVYTSVMRTYEVLDGISGSVCTNANTIVCNNIVQRTANADVPVCIIDCIPRMRAHGPASSPGCSLILSIQISERLRRRPRALTGLRG